jgi:hypothetical protein
MNPLMALSGHSDETHLMSALRGKAEVLPLTQSGSQRTHRPFRLTLDLIMMSSRMPPVPPGNRSNKGPASRPNTLSKEKSLKDEHHPNAAEEGETANIKQNTTNKGFFRGRRYEK